MANMIGKHGYQGVPVLDMARVMALVMARARAGPVIFRQRQITLFFGLYIDGHPVVIAYGRGRLFYLDRSHLRLMNRAVEVHMQKTVIKGGGGYFDSLGQHESALELALGDTAMDKNPVFI